MSMLSCDRSGCNNIMCDRFSYKHGYICNECYDDLLHKPFVNIEEFMESEKPDFQIGDDVWEGYLDKEFCRDW